jgi:hypothetical protein
MKAASRFLLVFILVFSNGLEAGTKQGAMIVVQKNDGRQIQGELIAVRKDSLVLLDSESGIDAAVAVEEIEIVHILKGPKTGIGAVSGFLVGGAVGAAAAGKNSDCGGCPHSIGRNLLGGVLVGGLGALIGALIGSTAGDNEIIILRGLSREERDVELGRLRLKARIRDFR